MKSYTSFVLLLVLTAVVSTSTASVGQSVPGAGSSLTVEEKAYLEDITGEFCLWLNNAVKEGIPLPKGDLELRSGVITPAEVQALIPTCERLMRLMQQAIDAGKTPSQPNRLLR